MTSITEKITENDISFEIYADGDCVIQVDKPGFFQISQDMISKIYKSRKLQEASFAGSNPLQSILNRSNPVKKDPKSFIAPTPKVEVKERCSPSKYLEDDAFLYVQEPLVVDNLSPESASVSVLPDSEAPVIKSDEVLLSDEKSDENDLSGNEDKIKRSLVAPSQESAGWSCTMRIKGKEPIIYKYISRRFARSANPDDEIGQNGRIS